MRTHYICLATILIFFVMHHLFKVTLKINEKEDRLVRKKTLVGSKRICRWMPFKEGTVVIGGTYTQCFHLLMNAEVR